MGSGIWEESAFWDSQDSSSRYVFINGKKYGDLLFSDKSKKDLNPRPCCLSFLSHWKDPFVLTGDTVKVFDLLYLNGQPLINKSTKFRKRNLKACIKGIQGRIELVTDFEARTAMDVRKRMEDVMAARGEGLVMKHPDAGYILNGRNKDWIKARISFL